MATEHGQLPMLWSELQRTIEVDGSLREIVVLGSTSATGSALTTGSTSLRGPESRESCEAQIGWPPNVADTFRLEETSRQIGVLIASQGGRLHAVSVSGASAR